MRFRALLLRLGPVFVKIGQYLALRPDLLPQDYCNELMKLTDQVDPVPWSVVRDILTAEFGRPPEEAFAWIDPRPVAAASLSQVHRAIMADGRKVAVKVQRPGIHRQVARNLASIRRVLQALPPLGGLALLDRKGVIAEIERWLQEELDLRREFVNSEALHQAARGREDFRVPQPVAALSSHRVLTLDFFDGVPCSELLHMIQAGNADRIQALGIDRIALARNLTRATLFQVFAAPLFHADPHPGNLIALPGDLVGFVDLGIVDRLDPHVRAGQIRYISAIISGDTDRILAVLQEILHVEPGGDFEAFRIDFLDGMRRWRRERDLAPQADRSHSPLAGYMIQLMQSAQRHRLRVPSEVLSMYRALLAAESVAFALGGDAASLRQEAEQFFTQLQLDGLIDQLSPRQLQGLLADYAGLIRESPGRLSRLLADLADDRFVLRTQTAEAPEERRAQNARTRLLTLAILFVGLASWLGDLPPMPVLWNWTLHQVGSVLLALWLVVTGILWVRLR